MRLKNLENKMDKDPEYAKLYEEQVDKFIKHGYAMKIDEAEEAKSRIWYLPHFGVISPNKPGKLRLVFDAAAKTQGISLNDKFLAGPDMLNSLLGVLMRFRQKPITFIGDIKDMFLRIKIREEDQDVQRFLWRGSDRTRAPDVYRMASMIFGTKSSPCSAMSVRNYTEEEAITLIRQVSKINKNGGFEMHKWVSNSQAVLDSIPYQRISSQREPLISR